jgi:hypothetical protein
MLSSRPLLFSRTLENMNQNQTNFGQQKQSTLSNQKDETILEVFKWVFFAFALLLTLLSILSKSFLSSISFLAIALLLFPLSANYLKGKLPFFKNRIFKGIGLLVLTMIGVVSSDFSSRIDKLKHLPKSVEQKKNIIKDYIENDLEDNSIQNVKGLVEAGELFGKWNYSTKNPSDEHISKQIDSDGKEVFVFTPLFDFKEAKYLKNDVKKGKITDYKMFFEVDSIGSIVSKKTIISYSKIGEVEYIGNEVPSLSFLIDEGIVNSQKEMIAKEKQREDEKKAQEKQYEEQKKGHEEQMQRFEKKCLSSWDGSHRELVKYVKKNMNNPKSFEHVETRYGVTNGYAGIVMVYRGTNAFGAIVTNSIKAKISLEDCSIISVEE